MTTPPGGQPPYGEPNQPPGGQPPYQPPNQPPNQPPYGGYPFQQDHPKAQTAMVLGILGLVLCQVLAPFAWVMGKKTVAEIDASGGRLGGRSTAQSGYILGVVGTIILILGVVLMVVYLVFIVVVFGAAGIASST